MKPPDRYIFVLNNNKWICVGRSDLNGLKNGEFYMTRHCHNNEINWVYYGARCTYILSNQCENALKIFQREEKLKRILE